MILDIKSDLQKISAVMSATPETRSFLGLSYKTFGQILSCRERHLYTVRVIQGDYVQYSRFEDLQSAMDFEFHCNKIADTQAIIFRADDPRVQYL